MRLQEMQSANLIVLKEENGENKKKIMVAAHMDEIGLCVVKITPEGFLKVKKSRGCFGTLLFHESGNFPKWNCGNGSFLCKTGRIQKRRD